MVTTTAAEGHKGFPLPEVEDFSLPEMCCQLPPQETEVCEVCDHDIDEYHVSLDACIRRFGLRSTAELRNAIQKYGKVLVETNPGASKRIYIIGIIHRNPKGNDSQEDKQLVLQGEVETYRIIDHLIRVRGVNLIFNEALTVGERYNGLLAESEEPEKLLSVFHNGFVSTGVLNKINTGDDGLASVIQARDENGKMLYGDSMILLEIMNRTPVWGAENLDLKNLNRTLRQANFNMHTFNNINRHRSVAMFDNAVQSLQGNSPKIPVIVTGGLHLNDCADFVREGRVTATATNVVETTLDAVNKPLPEGVGITLIATHSEVEGEARAAKAVEELQKAQSKLEKILRRIQEGNLRR